MTELSVALSQSLAFTGTSDTGGSGGAFVDLEGVVLDFDQTGGPVTVELSGFQFDFPTGPSWMGIDIVVRVDGVDQGSFRRFVPETRWDPAARRFVWMTPNLAVGRRRIGFGVRSVLFGGPPATVQLEGQALLRVTGQTRVLSFDPPGPLRSRVNEDVVVKVRLATAPPEQVQLSVTAANGLAQVLTPSPVIPQGETVTSILLRGVTDGTEFITVTAPDYVPATLSVKLLPPLVIDGFTPAEGWAYDAITVTGRGFFGGHFGATLRATGAQDVSATIIHHDDTKCRVIIPLITGPGGPFSGTNRFIYFDGGDRGSAISTGTLLVLSPPAADGRLWHLPHDWSGRHCDHRSGRQSRQCP